MMSSIIRLLTILLLFMVPYVAHSEVVRCTTLGWNPSNGNDENYGGLLDRYYIAENGVGGRDCWVHKSANQKDFVITPNSWGQNPNPGKKILIDMAFEAMQDSRRELSKISPLDIELVMLLNDVHNGAEAYWFSSADTQCWMEAGPRGGLGSWREEDGGLTLFKGTVAHEVAHCFIMNELVGFGYRPDTYNSSNARWWDESGSDFYASIIYPDLKYTYDGVSHFDLDGSSFLQPYKASVLFNSYANEKGNESVSRLIKEMFLGANQDIAQLLPVLRAQGFSSSYHNFVVDHFQSKVKDPAGNFFPREPTVNSKVKEELELGDHEISVDNMSPARLNMIELDIPKKTKATISSNVNDVDQTLLVNGQEVVRNWSGESHEIPSDCGKPSVVNILYSHLNDAPANAKISYKLEESPDTAENCEIDKCLIGTWSLDAENLVNYIKMQVPLVSFGVDIKDYNNSKVVEKFDSNGFSNEEATIEVTVDEKDWIAKSLDII